MRTQLNDAHPLAVLAVLTLIGLLAMGALMGVATSTLSVLGVDISFMGNLGVISDPHGPEVMALKFMQIAQAIGLFVVPYVLYKYWLRAPAPSLVGSSNQWSALVVFSLTVLCSLPVINFLADWNSQLSLPEAFDGINNWIRSTESNVEELIRLFLVMDDYGDLAFNLFLIALLPAISEEVFFRGTVQPLVMKMVRRPHIAIWLTAFIFSFFHMQFLGFVPRMLLGAVFGYAAHWSGSLLLPMAGHFVNNGVAVLLTWFIGREAILPETETIGANGGEWWVALLSGLVLVAGLVLVDRLFRTSKRKDKS